MAWSGDFTDFESIDSSPYHDNRSLGYRINDASRHATAGQTQATGSRDFLNETSQRMKIADLSPGMSSSMIRGIVIAKEQARHFPSKKDPASERHVLGFTLRDTATDFINVSCWGGLLYVQDLQTAFGIGDVVEVVQAGVQSKPMDGSDERYRPWTPSLYQLSLGETRGSVRLVTEHMPHLTQLSHIPVKAHNDFFTIVDINVNGQQLDGQYLSLLVVVKSVGPIKDITTKTGRQMRRCELKLFDETAPTFLLVLWDDQVINIAQLWSPKENVLFVADVRVAFDNFKKCMVASATSKTIFTVNPDTLEAHQLFRYAQTVDLECSTEADADTTDLSCVQDVYSVAEMLARTSAPDADPVTAIVYAHVTALDIDSDRLDAVTRRCARCKRRLGAVSGRCESGACPQGSVTDGDPGDTEWEAVYNVRLALTDHTGTLPSCSLTHSAATTMIGCTAEEFLQLPTVSKTSSKWKYLLEKCKLYVKTTPPTSECRRATSRVISCEPANFEEALAFLV